MRIIRFCWDILRGAWAGFLRHDGIVMAGHMSFLGLMSIFPFLIFLVLLAGEIGATDWGFEAIGQMLQTLPPDVAAVIAGPVTEVLDGISGGLLTFGAVIALWTASTGLEAARAAVRRAFLRRAVQPVWTRRLESLGLVLVISALILVGMSIQVLGPPLWEAVDAYLDTPPAVDRAWRWVRLGFSPLILLAAVYGLYLALSPRRIRPIYRLPGAVLALAVWLATAAGLSIYLENFADYRVTYGSLAGVMVTLLFFFVISIGFVMGAELNAALTRHAKLASAANSRP